MITPLTILFLGACWVYYKAHAQRIHELRQQRAILCRMVKEGRAGISDLFAFDDKYPNIR